MSHQIYSNGQFKIYKTLDGYIVHNSNKPFDKGHTHIKNFGTAKYLTHLGKYKKVPNRLTQYLIISLIRISEDYDYISQLAYKLGSEYMMKCNKSKCGKPKSTTSKKRKSGGCKKPKN